jgi:hypothetical protein
VCLGPAVACGATGVHISSGMAHVKCGIAVRLQYSHVTGSLSAHSCRMCALALAYVGSPFVCVCCSDGACGPVWRHGAISPGHPGDRCPASTHRPEEGAARQACTLLHVVPLCTQWGFALCTALMPHGGPRLFVLVYVLNGSLPETSCRRLAPAPPPHTHILCPCQPCLAHLPPRSWSGSHQCPAFARWCVTERAKTCPFSIPFIEERGGKVVGGWMKW